MKLHLLAVTVYVLTLAGSGLGPGARSARGRAKESADAERPVVLKWGRVWDAVALDAHSDWIVVVQGETIKAAGPRGGRGSGQAETVDLPGMTLLPGLIDAHTHVLLHPYDEALWNDQVLKEAFALRVCRATNHLRSTLLSGFTTIRDLGRKEPAMPMSDSSRLSHRGSSRPANAGGHAGDRGHRQLCTEGFRTRV